ncbi:hypothetical protein LARI1_G009601 [Lachnellula arida]|uniref:Uncharacterized protein n=1 Tax=Lachnellula arida TaxID=1316785 RepID=A0A8T9B1F3_9HELO|nr:hypothetical protein LARI1_G009601 [Lachnellula arida]
MPVQSKITSVKDKERKRCYRGILDCSVDMISCTACEKSGKKCVAREGLSRCAECVRRGFSKCDMGGPLPSDWSSLDRNKEALERDLDDAVEKQRELSARIDRIQRHRKFLRQRETEMLRRGLASLDELDEAEERGREEESKRTEQEAPPVIPLDGVGSSGNPLGSDFFLDPVDPALAAALSAYDPNDPYWQGAGLGTPQTSQGS